MTVPLVLFLLLAAAGAGDWTDRGEYDLALQVRAEPSPKKKLLLLEQWKAKYPNSGMRQARRELLLATHQSLGDTDGMLATAREMAADQPDNLVGLYWTAILIPRGKDVSAPTLELGEKSARALLGNAGWIKQDPGLQAQARRTLCWALWQRGDYAGAQTELTTWLRDNPGAAEASAWLGMVLSYEKKPEMQPAALWHLARAGVLRGEGALPDRQQRQVAGLLDKLYSSYHGEPEGLDDLRTKAAAAAFPPEGFTIEAAAARAARRQEEELERTNPMLAAWLRLRKKVEGPGGAEYFTQTLRGSPLPRLAGAVIRCTPPNTPTEIVLAIRDATTEELVLRFPKPLPREVEPGTRLEFEAVADSFTADPFLLIALVTPEQVTGLPAKR